MSTFIESRKRTNSSYPERITKMGGVAAAFFISVSVAFQATATLGISSALASNLYFALNFLSWAAAAAAVVASFGIGAAVAGLVFGLAKRWALRQFVAW
ncbi:MULTISPECIES: hypothetical protein [Arthrobacter]|uniref:Uncharacterized protein n=1 Tax=Arthrobacter terricola TaxID=2547396 RepID=A0A4R5KT31_9MICC|nr:MULTISPECIES: hypothetical protein [Arthrobacter]MBT8159931.1 hypothetical protein [Arthrobacter sp. GN70]TDF98991.1 hypothetical protein E1809_05255 [Arthrobacter terricola]